MSVELHLPDLPEVPVALGAEPAPPGAPRPPSQGWGERVRHWLLSYLPLLVLVALVLGSWWLVRTAPRAPGAAAASAPRHEADYQLDRFEMQRWQADGQLRARLEGRQLRHYPDTEALEVEALRVTLRSPDGRLTEATARQAVVAGDGTQARLEGDVVVHSQGRGAEPPVTIRGQRFVLNVDTRQVRTDQPVTVQQGHSQFSADALDFDALKGQLSLHGEVRVRFQPERPR